MPRRTGFYFAFGVGLLFAYVLSVQNAPFPVLLALGLFLGVVVWLAFRRRPAGMDISGAEWRFFVGNRRWRIPLADVAAVSVIRWADRPVTVALTFHNGRSDVLPQELVPEIERLTHVLERKGIRVIS